MTEDLDAAAMLARGRAAFAAQPFSRMLGAELVAFSREQTEIRLEVRDELRQQHGFVHGGVLAYLADNALTFAGGAALQGMVVTSELKLNYARPAVGTELVAKAAIIAAGRTQSVVRCEVFSVEDGVPRLCAAGQGTVVSMRPRSADD